MLHVRRDLRVFHLLGRTLITQVQAQAEAATLPVDAWRDPEVHGRVLVAEVLVLGHQRHVVAQIQAQRPVVVQRQACARLHRVTFQRKVARNRVGQHERRLVRVDPAPPGAALPGQVSVAEMSVQAYLAQLMPRRRIERTQDLRGRHIDIVQPPRFSAYAQRYVHITRIRQHQPRRIPLLRTHNR